MRLLRKLATNFETKLLFQGTHTLTNQAPKTTNIYWDFDGRVLINFLEIATFTRMNCLTTHELNILNFFEHVLHCFT